MLEVKALLGGDEAAMAGYLAAMEDLALSYTLESVTLRKKLEVSSPVIARGVCAR